MYHPLAHMKARQGEFQEALSLAARCREIHRENGAMWSYWVYAEIEWDIKMLAGEMEEALEILSESYEQSSRWAASRSNPPGWRNPSTRSAGSTRPSGARRRPSMRSTTISGGPRGMGALARVRARQGRFEEAEAMAREAVAYFAGTDYSKDRPGSSLDLAEVLRLAGRPDEAIATIREAIGLFEQREDVVSAAHARALIEDLTNAGA